MGDSMRTWPRNIKHAASFGARIGARAATYLSEASAKSCGTRSIGDVARATPARRATGAAHGVGDLDAALPRLERAIDARDPCLVDLAVAPQWDALRAHPRFAQCLGRMGL
jgi:hypothetical protein